MDQLLPFTHPPNSTLFSVRLETGQIRGPAPELPIYSLTFLNSDPCSSGVMLPPPPKKLIKAVALFFWGKTHMLYTIFPNPLKPNPTALAGNPVTWDAHLQPLPDTLLPRPPPSFSPLLLHFRRGPTGLHPWPCSLGIVPGEALSGVTEGTLTQKVPE